MGPDCVSAFNGDFAFAIHDRRRRRLVLARDRMGVRPLFYTHAARLPLFRFRDESALRRSPASRRRSTRSPSTRSSPSGSRSLRARPSVASSRCRRPISSSPMTRASRVRPYWRLDYPDAGDADALDRRDERVIAEELRALLLDATRIRLRADVPVGAYLSGGLDSSIIAAAAQSARPRPAAHLLGHLRRARSSTRAPGSGEMVRALGTDHSAVPCTAADIGRDLPRRHPRTPSSRCSAPRRRRFLRSSKLVRESGFKVVLTGEGADELFAGYDIFKEAKLRRFCAAQPGFQAPPASLRAPLPLSPALAGPEPALPRGFLRSRARCDATTRSSRTCRASATPPRAKLFFSAAIARAARRL